MAQKARDFLVAAAATEVGRIAMRDLGLPQYVLDNPQKGDDSSTVRIAAAVQRVLHQRYPQLF